MLINVAMPICLYFLKKKSFDGGVLNYGGIFSIVDGTQWRTIQVVSLPDGKWAPLDIRQYAPQAVCVCVVILVITGATQYCRFFFQFALEFSNFCESIIQEKGYMDRNFYKSTCSGSSKRPNIVVAALDFPDHLVSPNTGPRYPVIYRQVV
jgi:hypothetical protein